MYGDELLGDTEMAKEREQYENACNQAQTPIRNLGVGNAEQCAKAIGGYYKRPSPAEEAANNHRVHMEAAQKHGEAAKFLELHPEISRFIELVRAGSIQF